MQKDYKITKILDKETNKQRTDGRYGKRIGRICSQDFEHFSEILSNYSKMPLIICYKTDEFGNDYSGYYLRTSPVEKMSRSGKIVEVETLNSIYVFEEV